MMESRKLVLSGIGGIIAPQPNVGKHKAEGQQGAIQSGLTEPHRAAHRVSGPDFGGYGTAP